QLLTLALIDQDAQSAVVILPDPMSNAFQATVSLHPTTLPYRIFAIGQSDATVNAGLYAVSVTPAGGGAAAFGPRALPIGRVQPVGNVTLDPGDYTFSLKDLAFPAALTNLGAALIRDGQLVIPPLSATGSASLTTTTRGTYNVLALATPAATPG